MLIYYSIVRPFADEYRKSGFFMLLVDFSHIDEYPILVIILRCKTITKCRIMYLGLLLIFDLQIPVKLESFIRPAVSGRHV